MTGFGRTGSKLKTNNAKTLLFAAQENVQPDFLCLAKGLTGGYLPMAATLTTQKVFDAFLGEYNEFKTFFHGHSFTGNQLGAAAALASLEILQSKKSIHARQNLEKHLRDELKSLWSLPNVGDIRQVGLIAGIELVKNWRTREPFDLRERAGIRVCEAMAKARRADAARRQRHRADAAVLHDRSAIGKNRWRSRARASRRCWEIDDELPALHFCFRQLQQPLKLHFRQRRHGQGAIVSPASFPSEFCRP